MRCQRPSTHPGGDHFSSSQQIFASSRRIPTAAEGARPQLSIVRIMNFLWTVCSVSCVSHFDSARRALNVSRTSTHHISTSYRTLIGLFGQAPTRGVTIFLLRNKFLQVVEVFWPSTHPGGDHFSSSQQIFASSRRIPTAAEGARPQLSIVRIMNFLWTVCSVSCVSHFDSARRALNATLRHITFRRVIVLWPNESNTFGQAPRPLKFGQAPTRGVTIFLLRNKFLQVVDA